MFLQYVYYHNRLSLSHFLKLIRSQIPEREVSHLIVNHALGSKVMFANFTCYKGKEWNHTPRTPNIPTHSKTKPLKDFRNSMLSRRISVICLFFPICLIRLICLYLFNFIKIKDPCHFYLDFKLNLFWNTKMPYLVHSALSFSCFVWKLSFLAAFGKLNNLGGESQKISIDKASNKSSALKLTLIICFSLVIPFHRLSKSADYKCLIRTGYFFQQIILLSDKHR